MPDNGHCPMLGSAATENVAWTNTIRLAHRSLCSVPTLEQ